jgi:radical SAM protein with 4Fe4S-binding SPASM domain
MASTNVNRIVVMWELTRACDLHCLGCTIGASEARGRDELSTYEAYKTIDQIVSLAPRELILTGGDPLARPDLFQIVDYAHRRGLEPAVVLSSTSQLSGVAIQRLAWNGAARAVLPINGSTPKIHQAVQGAFGTFATTLHAMHWAESAGLGVEVNTLITRRNAVDLDAIAALLRPAGIVRWNLHFLVPFTTAAQGEMLLASEVEALFGRIDEIREREAFEVRVIEAPHYRRHCQQHHSEVQRDDGVVFISHGGDVRAGEFLPISAGNLRYRPLGAIYRAGDLFVALRDNANLKGKCGRCEYREICGGSRARAWAMEGNLFADDPLCIYEPGAPLPLPMVAHLPQEASS